MRVHVTIVAIGQQWVLRILSVSLALVMQHAMLMLSIILSSVVCVWLYHSFPRYFTKGTIFGKKDTEHKIYFDFIYNIFPLYYLFQEQLSEILSQMYIVLHVMYSFLSDFNHTWLFSAD